MVFKVLADIFSSKKPKLVTTEAYQRWREMIFSVKPEQVEVSKSDANRVFGVIMDIGQIDLRASTNWAISLSAFPTGEASFHPTPGGSVAGLGGDPKVAQVAQEIVQNAQVLLPETNPTQDLSLPEPGYVQFFFLTTSGVRVFKGHLDKLQKPENPFGQLLNQFGFIRQFADQILDKNREFNINTLYILAFTPEKKDANTLTAVTHLAIDQLEAKDPVFKQRMEECAESNVRFEIANTQYIATMHTPTNMRTSMMGWLKKQYNVTFNPTAGNDFFLHGMRDPQGKENFILFYFDIE